LGKRQERSEQVWVRRKPLLFRAEEVVPPPVELPYYFVSFEILEETAKGGELELLDDVQRLKRVSIYGLEKIFGREKMKNLITLLYKNLGFTIRKMADMLNRPPTVVWRWVRRYEIPVRPHYPPYHVFKVVPREAWLEPYPRKFMYEDRWWAEYTVLPSKELAYLFGFIVAEGHAYRDGVNVGGKKLPKYEWAFGEAVGEVAGRVADELIIEEKKPTVSIYYLDDLGRHVPKEKATWWRVYIFSRALSHTFGFPRWYERLMKTMMEPEFFPPFTAGVWDGDGSFAYEKEKPHTIDLFQEFNKRWWMKQMREALEGRGIKTSLRGPWKGTNRFVHAGKEYIGETRVFTLRILKESWGDFIEMIKPYLRHPEKKERAKEFLEFVKGGGGST